jgi:hypothetical protein
MKRRILLIMVGGRNASAVRVQQLLTEYGCSIKTRLGIHDGVLHACSDAGLIILELVGKAAEHRVLIGKLNALAKVKTKLVDISLS